MFTKSDITRNECQLFGGFAKCGYDWWWHSFTARHSETNEEKAFFIEFFLCNPKDGCEIPLLGQKDVYKKHNIKPSYLMVKVGTWGEDARQLHKFYGWKKIKVMADAPFFIDSKDCYLDEEKTYGSVSLTKEEVELHPEYMCDEGEISWDLKIQKVLPYNVGYGASKFFRKLQLFEMFWHVEGMKTLYSGEIIYNNEKYIVTPETSYGYADKNWGRDFTSPWVWLSSNNLISAKNNKRLTNSAFDIGGGRPKIGPIALNRKLLSAFYYEGREFEFNFSKFWTLPRTKFDCKETDAQIVWHVEQKTLRNKMIVDIICDKKDMLLVNYEAPNGSKKHNKLWNGGNGRGLIKLYRDGKLIDEIVAKNVGCEYGEYDK